MHFGKFDINTILLSQFYGGGPAVTTIKNNVYIHSIFKQLNPKDEMNNFISELENFVNARTDQHRIFRSQLVSNFLLQHHDLEEFIEVREIVAKLETERIITYQQQRDHTAHTLYLFLLGIWLFDNLPNIREYFKQQYLKMPKFKQFFEKYRNGEHDYYKVDQLISRIFVFQWIYASLLHDIGYIFAELSDNTKDYQNFIFEKIFSEKWFIDKNIQGVNDDFKQKKICDAIKAAHQKFQIHYNKLLTSSDLHLEPTKILKRLNQIPWIADYSPENIEISEPFETLKLFDPSNSKSPLQLYADDLAENGHNENDNGAVDHAVASGLILFQYSSYYYYMLDLIKQEDPDVFSELTQIYDYSDKSNLFREILPACKATAYHNLEPSHDKYSFEKISIEKEPLLYLSVLCDELADWERLPVGYNKVTNLAENAQRSLQSPDIEIKIASYRNDSRCDIIIKNASFLYKELIKKLDKKLVVWQDFVNIISTD